LSPPLRIFIVSITNDSSSSGTGTWSPSSAARFLMGSERTGPCFSLNSSLIPIASETTSMSEKSIAASTPSRSTGCMVTFAASSGVLQSVRKSTCSRTSLYSGMYLPA
jgi:hypothetical protein